MFRNAQESQYYRDLFHNKGIKIISVTEHIDEESTSGRLSTNILSVIDQYQSEIISDHVKSSMREMVRQGYYTGGRVIFGYKLQTFKHGSKERKKFIVEESEAQIVTMIFEMYAKGQNRCGSHCFGISSYSTNSGEKYEYCSYVCAKKKKYRICSVPQFNKIRLRVYSTPFFKGVSASPNIALYANTKR